MGRAREASSGGAAGRTLFCDTNVLVRVLTGEPASQAESAAGALEAAGAGLFTLVVPDLVLAEVAYVLSSFGMPAPQAAEHLAQILDLPGVEVVDEVMIRDAVDLWAEGKLDFADAYLAALARRFTSSGVLSFDRDLDRVEGVTRFDPSAHIGVGG